MSEKSESPKSICDHKAASTLAASSIMQYFKKHGWKMISFFPNSPCAMHKKDKK